MDILLPSHAKLANLLTKPKRKIGQYKLNEVVLGRIWLERLRQKELFKSGKLDFACDSPVVDPHRKLAVITEELGEVAKEILEQKKWTRKVSRMRLRNELTQLVAVGHAWLESLEDQPS